MLGTQLGQHSFLSEIWGKNSLPGFMSVLGVAGSEDPLLPEY